MLKIVTIEQIGSSTKDAGSRLINCGAGRITELKTVDTTKASFSFQEELGAYPGKPKTYKTTEAASTIVSAIDQSANSLAVPLMVFPDRDTSSAATLKYYELDTISYGVDNADGTTSTLYINKSDFGTEKIVVDAVILQIYRMVLNGNTTSTSTTTTGS